MGTGEKCDSDLVVPMCMRLDSPKTEIIYYVADSVLFLVHMVLQTKVFKGKCHALL